MGLGRDHGAALGQHVHQRGCKIDVEFIREYRQGYEDHQNRHQGMNEPVPQFDQVGDKCFFWCLVFHVQNLGAQAL